MGNIWANNFFQENLALSRTISYVFLIPCQNLEKTRDSIRRKSLDRKMEGRTDGQTLFYRTFAATALNTLQSLPSSKEYIQIEYSNSNFFQCKVIFSMKKKPF